MKSIIIILALFISLGTACKTKKSAIATTRSTTSASVQTGDTGTSATGNNEGINTGKISHKYRSTGCETVIIIQSEGGSEITLIPKDKLSNDVDMDGQLIRFDYKTLKMPQPAGCNVGMPAEITNITKLK